MALALRLEAGCLAEIRSCTFRNNKGSVWEDSEFTGAAVSLTGAGSFDISSCDFETMLELTLGLAERWVLLF